jgi:nicotinamide-nucleotide amidase
VSDPTTAERVGERLRETGATVAVAEGHTGGRVFAALTAVPGASDYAERGYSPYSYDALRAELAIPRETLDDHGVVAAPTTRAMARAARDRADATWGVATTGVAGPAGGDSDAGRPVGTTFVGVAYAAPWGSGDSFARVSRTVVEGDSRGERLDAGADLALERLATAIDEAAAADDDEDGDD